MCLFNSQSFPSTDLYDRCAVFFFSQEPKVSVNTRVRLETDVVFAGELSLLNYTWESDDLDLGNSALLNSDTKSPFLVIAQNALEPGAFTFIYIMGCRI